MNPIIDPEDPDHRLRWPKEVLEAELGRRLRLASSARAQRLGHTWAKGAGRLLRSAFAGPSLAEEFDAQGSIVGYRDPIDARQVPWLRQLRIDLVDARTTPPQRPYWSARLGAKTPTSLDLRATAERFVSLVGRLDQDQAIWAEAFGTDCPDGVGDPVDSPSVQFEHLTGRAIGGGVPWPLTKAHATMWTRDDLFDLIEVLYDLASWPGTWEGHNYGGCVGHPGDFSMACGQALYRHDVNALLAGSDLGVQLAARGEDDGRIVLAESADLSRAVDRSIDSAPDGHEHDVAHAVALFRSRTRDVTSMRSAIVTLAGVVEAHRGLLKEELLTKDEGALFDIANNFNLRHRKADQRTDYDPTFLEWIFHWYLATISLVTKLGERHAGQEGPGS